MRTLLSLTFAVVLSAVAGLMLANGGGSYATDRPVSINAEGGEYSPADEPPILRVEGGEYAPAEEPPILTAEGGERSPDVDLDNHSALA